MAQESIFQVMAQGIGNANQNIVDTYKLIEELADKIDAIHDALFPQDTEETNVDGSPTNDK